ncbi:hypothetical protein HAX54_042752 [Datura stramonium]|uniref:Uncharacterized protein n=1 Tax=Datura stramonium TaxID=4076 RepID=A0ABS8SMT3_DATST|nr:hypothetical protein [Datura stramonium]
MAVTVFSFISAKSWNRVSGPAPERFLVPLQSTHSCRLPVTIKQRRSQHRVLRLSSPDLKPSYQDSSIRPQPVDILGLGLAVRRVSAVANRGERKSVRQSGGKGEEEVVIRVVGGVDGRRREVRKVRLKRRELGSD